MCLGCVTKRSMEAETKGRKCSAYTHEREMSALREELLAREREIAELKGTLKEHKRTCPATRNQLMLEQGHSTTFSDVRLVSGETVLHVHKSILASRCSTVLYNSTGRRKPLHCPFPQEADWTVRHSCV